MKINRKENGIRNIKYGIINKFITVVFPFIMRTVIIYILGSEYLGLNSLFSSILQVLSLTELGIGSAMVFELYKPIADNDKNKICEYQEAYKVIYEIIGVIILIIGIVLIPFLPKFISGTYPNNINIYILYFLYLFNTFSSYFFFAYKSSILNAYQRRDIILNIGTVTHIILYLLQLICLLFFKNYYLYVIWLPIFTIIENILKAIYTKKMYPDLIPSKKLDKNIVKTLFSKVKYLFGHKLSNVVTNSVDTIVISTFLGLKMVTIYNNYYYLITAIAGVLDILYQGIVAGIGNSIASECIEKNKKDFYHFLYLNSWIIGWCTICFLCLFQPMIELWVGKTLMLDISSIILLCIYFYVWKIRQVVLVFKDAAGMWDIDKYKPYVEIFVNLIVNIILVNIIGINGIIISTIISMLFISLPWETKVFYKIYFNESTKKYYVKMFIYTLITLMGCILCYYICSLILLKGILELITKLIICIFVPNIIFIVFNLKNENFKYFINIIKKIIFKKAVK